MCAKIFEGYAWDVWTTEIHTGEESEVRKGAANKRGDGQPENQGGQGTDHNTLLKGLETWIFVF